VNGALLRYRIMAWIVGIMLLLVTAATVVKYAADDPRWIGWVGPVHGFLYIVYLITTLDLAFRLRWSVLRAIVVCLAGTVPFLSFVAEHRVTQRVKAQARSDASRAARAA
jgi:integral membrane protein